LQGRGHKAWRFSARTRTPTHQPKSRRDAGICTCPACLRPFGTQEWNWGPPLLALKRQALCPRPVGLSGGGGILDQELPRPSSHHSRLNGATRFRVLQRETDMMARYARELQHSARAAHHSNRAVQHGILGMRHSAHPMRHSNRDLHHSRRELPPAIRDPSVATREFCVATGPRSVADSGLRVSTRLLYVAILSVVMRRGSLYVA
jgi:hypothetical protein